MNRSAYFAAVLFLSIIFIATQGFQCGSPDLTSGKLYYSQYESSAPKDTTKLNLALISFEHEVMTKPNSAEGWYWVGMIYGIKQDYGRLNDAWKNSSRLSNQMQTDIDKNRIYFWSKAFNDGVKSLQKARVTQKSSQYVDAINYFKGAIDLQPDSSAKYGAYLYYAACYWDLKKYDQALPALNDAIAKENSEEAYRIIGSYYTNRGNDHKKLFQEKNSDALTTLATLPKLKKGIPSKEVVEMLGEPTNKKTLAKKSEEWTFNKGFVVKFEDGKIVSAAFVRSSEPKLDSTEMYNARKEFDEALTILKQGSAAHPTSDNLRSSLINVYIESNRAKEGLDLFKSEVTKNPGDKVAHYNYGVVLLSDKQYESAIEQFKKALEIDPKYENTLYNIGRAYVNEGVEVREKAMKDTPDPAQQSKEYLKKYESAIPYLEQYLILKPNDIESWELIAKIYLSIGKSDKATEAFENADKLRNPKK